MSALARTPEEWERAVVALGGRPFHGRQVFRWIMVKNVTSPEAMTDLPAGLREKLALDLTPPLTITRTIRSADSTRKLICAVANADAPIETVVIPMTKGKPGELPSPIGTEDLGSVDSPEDDEDEDAPPLAIERQRVTQCISTQVGCAMGCVFCASGVAGLKRHLRADEIVAQVLAGRAHLDPGEELRNVVYMGMGEPLHNYDETVRSVRILSHRDGISLSLRRITISTSGLVPEIARLGEDFGGKIGLAVSLHAANDETRGRIMPINKKYPLKELMRALRAYPLPPRRRITIEYTLIAGKNDAPEEARELARLLRGLPVKVNLIPMNPIDASTLSAPSFRGVLAFQQILCDAGYSCFIRRTRGDDVSAACGQLALAGAKPKVRVNRA